MVPKLKRMFPRSNQNHDMDKRSPEAFEVKRGLTERLIAEEVGHPLYAEVT